MNKNLSIALVLVSAAIAGIIFATNNRTLGDAELLRSAVENKLSVTTQTIEYDGGLIVDVDYSDISNVLASGVLSDEDGVDYAQYIDASDRRIYLKLLPSASGADLTDQIGIDFSQLDDDVIDRWVYIDDSDLLQEQGSLLFDTFFDDSVPVENIAELTASERGVFLALGATLQGIATVHGETPEGNFSEDQTDELLASYDDLGLFSILEEGEQLEQNGRSLRKLELELNAETATELNQLVEGYTDQESSFANFLGGITGYSVSIDEDTQRFYEYFAADNRTVLRTDTAHGLDYTEDIPAGATGLRDL